MELVAIFSSITTLVVFTIGFMVGSGVEARRWREKGDHEYMNRKESGGRLYQVKREDG